MIDKVTTIILEHLKVILAPMTERRGNGLGTLELCNYHSFFEHDVSLFPGSVQKNGLK
jgi:hypothetical protein